MAINKVIAINENDPKHATLIQEVTKGMENKENLIIVARSDRNRKADEVAPIEIKNGIYFYLAYDLEGKLVFPGKYTAEDIYTAKTNMAKRCRLGGMFEILGGGGIALEDFREAKPMTVLTITGNANSAGLLYCPEIWKTIKTKIGDFRILPSSIHELIIVPDSEGIEKAALDEMVRGVNATEVSDNDYLADRSFGIEEWI